MSTVASGLSVERLQNSKITLIDIIQDEISLRAKRMREGIFQINSELNGGTSQSQAIPTCTKLPKNEGF